ncbi:hypothetical protein C8R47DRAFT_1076805 [Mycena vitilis]|nr:hypothetical protein C8R47DRAFT_1076805 [Mycena vitilis]
MFSIGSCRNNPLRWPMSKFGSKFELGLDLVSLYNNILNNLNHDVLLHTFVFFDIASIMRSTESKHVWIEVVHNLASRNLLALPPRDLLLSYSATELTQQVKRAMFGPCTWAATSPRPPKILRQIYVSMPDASTSSICQPALLAGDRHLLVSRGTGCELWDVAESRRLWARAGVIRSNFIAGTVHNGTQIFLAMWSPRPPVHLLPRAQMNPDQPDCKIVVQTHILDLRLGFERPLLAIQLPPNFTRFSELVLAGDLWAANVEWHLPMDPKKRQNA